MDFPSTIFPQATDFRTGIWIFVSAKQRISVLVCGLDFCFRKQRISVLLCGLDFCFCKQRISVLVCGLFPQATDFRTGMGFGFLFP